eukprot:246194_1
MILSPLSVYIMIIIAFTATHVLGGWEQRGPEIVGDSSGGYETTGGSVSSNSDGTIVAIGASYPIRSDYGNEFKGNVGVWEYDANVNIWEQRGDDIVEGSSIALSKDGDVVAIGIPGHSATGDCDCQVKVTELTMLYSGNGIVDIDFAKRKKCASQGVKPGQNFTCDLLNSQGNKPKQINVKEPDTNNILCSMTVDTSCSSDIVGTYGCDGTLMVFGWKDVNKKECSFAPYAGQTRIFEYKKQEWQQRGNDINGEEAGDASGLSVSLSDNGDVVAIGAPGNDEGGNNAGHVRIYEWVQRGKASHQFEWVQRGKDIVGDGMDLYAISCSVSLSYDGNVVAIDGLARMRVYQFVSEKDGWKQRGDDIAKMIPLELQRRRLKSGSTVSSSLLSRNGDIVAFASDMYVSVFAYDKDKDKWEQRGDDIDVLEGEDIAIELRRRLNIITTLLSVTLSSDGDVVAVGVPFTKLGNVRVYEYGSSGWKQRGDDISDLYATSVSLSSDGNAVAAAADAGNVHVYEYDSGCDAVDIDGFLGSCSTLWEENTVDIASIEDDIASLQADLSALKEEVHKGFKAVSNPVIKGRSVGGDLDTFGDADTFLGLTYNHMVLLISLMTNFILISIGCCMMWNAKKHKDYSLVVQSE